jgi:hypothetical protein
MMNPGLPATGGPQPMVEQGSGVYGRGWSGLVYAVGRLAPQFPSLGVEKEFAQLAQGAYQGGLVEMGSLRRVLDAPENRYLGRHLCWVFTAQHVDAFAVLPRDDADVDRLVAVLSPTESEDVVHVVVGRSAPTGAIDSPCAASGLPTVVADQLLAFTLDEFAAALPDADAAPGEEGPPTGDPPARDDDQTRKQFQAVVRDVFTRFTRSADNRGIAEEHRARNYCALRYPNVYHAVLQAYREGKMLVGVDARHSHHAGARRVVSVRLTFRHHRTDVTERYHCLVDVTEVFPFLVTRLQPTFD